jgi:Second Messenger Oligonucleotide or Dinucleotide Synthetase domain
MSVSDSFAKLISQIQPTDVEIQRAVQHSKQIRTRLEQSYNLRKLFAVGSFPRRTYVRRSSDIGLFAIFARDDLRCGDRYVHSSRALENLKQDLEGRYPSSAVYRDVHAIVIQFSDGVNVDVVPSRFHGMTQANRPIYKMPDGGDDWMLTAPELHAKYIQEADGKSMGKLRGTAQLMKFWRECRTPKVPLSSFHIEMLLASFRICEGVKSYAECVTEVLQLLAQRECQAFRDPLQIAGRIGATRSVLQRETTLRSIVYSRDHAKDALYAERHASVQEAKRQWDIVFNGHFPR